MIILFRREFVSFRDNFYPCEMKGNNTLADLKGHTYQETRKKSSIWYYFRTFILGLPVFKFFKSLSELIQIFEEWEGERRKNIRPMSSQHLVQFPVYKFGLKLARDHNYYSEHCSLRFTS